MWRVRVPASMEVVTWASSCTIAQHYQSYGHFWTLWGWHCQTTLLYFKRCFVLVQQDLTAWVTIGSMHIPHTEDIPIVETPGSQLSFILQPFNFLDPDPLPAPSTQPAEKTMQEMGNSPSSQKARDYECRPVLVKSSSTGSRLRQRSVFWHLCWSFCIAPAVSVWMSLHVQHQLKWFWCCKWFELIKHIKRQI